MSADIVCGNTLEDFDNNIEIVFVPPTLDNLKKYGYKIIQKAGTTKKLLNTGNPSNPSLIKPGNLARVIIDQVCIEGGMDKSTDGYKEFVQSVVDYVNELNIRKFHLRNFKIKDKKINMDVPTMYISDFIDPDDSGPSDADASASNALAGTIDAEPAVSVNVEPEEPVEMVAPSAGQVRASSTKREGGGTPRADKGKGPALGEGDAKANKGNKPGQTGGAIIDGKVVPGQAARDGQPQGGGGQNKQGQPQGGGGGGGGGGNQQQQGKGQGGGQCINIYNIMPREGNETYTIVDKGDAAKKRVSQIVYNEKDGPTLRVADHVDVEIEPKLAVEDEAGRFSNNDIKASYIKARKDLEKKYSELNAKAKDLRADPTYKELLNNYILNFFRDFKKIPLAGIIYELNNFVDTLESTHYLKINGKDVAINSDFVRENYYMAALELEHEYAAKIRDSGDPDDAAYYVANGVEIPDITAFYGDYDDNIAQKINNIRRKRIVKVKDSENTIAGKTIDLLKGTSGVVIAAYTFSPFIQQIWGFSPEVAMGIAGGGYYLGSKAAQLGISYIKEASKWNFLPSMPEPFRKFWNNMNIRLFGWGDKKLINYKSDVRQVISISKYNSELEKLKGLILKHRKTFFFLVGASGVLQTNVTSYNTYSAIWLYLYILSEANKLARSKVMKNSDSFINKNVSMLKLPSDQEVDAAQQSKCVKKVYTLIETYTIKYGGIFRHVFPEFDGREFDGIDKEDREKVKFDHGIINRLHDVKFSFTWNDDAGKEVRESYTIAEEEYNREFKSWAGSIMMFRPDAFGSRTGKIKLDLGEDADPGSSSSAPPPPPADAAGATGVGI